MAVLMSKQMVIPSTLPKVGTPLNDLTWDDIAKISDLGLGANYFSVGDRKAVTLNGKVGTLSVNTTLYAYIIGIDHNESIEGKGITFGTFKSDVSGGKDVVLCDSGYDDYYRGGDKYFNYNHWGQYNYGGWAGCDMRYDILGSTDKAPSGYGASNTSSRTGYDPSETCATNPVPNTLMSALPEELRAVIKPMTIYTDNKAGSSDLQSDVTATKDYLPLLAQFEVAGTISQINQYEDKYQKQYDYYKAGNSKIKYKHNATGTAVIWALRSAGYNSTSKVAIIGSGGSTSGSNADYSRGLAPIFRI